MSNHFSELHYIISVENVGYVVKYGILSRNQVILRNMNPQDISDSNVQQRRENISVPNGFKLHQYVNFYFHARNPMMYRLISENKLNKICVLKINKNIINYKDVVITDGNAATYKTKFLQPFQINELDFNAIFARSWTNSDQISELEHKRKKCAEVLVPTSISYENIHGAYVANDTIKKRLTDLGFDKEVTIKPDIFFR